MAFVEPVILRDRGIRMEPLGLQHEEGLRQAAADGELWRIRVTSVPEPAQTLQYIKDALAMREAGNRFAFAIVDEATETVLGSSSYHDIIAAVQRVEIGYTWYAKRCQRTHVNTTCKLLLMGHAFDTLGCPVVGWRTDNFNFDSQNAIERLGAKKRWGNPRPCSAPRWHHPRYRDVQHALRRMGRGACPTDVPARPPTHQAIKRGSACSLTSSTPCVRPSCQYR